MYYINCEIVLLYLESCVTTEPVTEHEGDVFIQMISVVVGCSIHRTMVVTSNMLLCKVSCRA